MAFEHIFPKENVTEIVNYYGQIERLDTTLEFNLYPLFLCLFIDTSILLGICGFFKIDIGTALVIALIVILAPISIPCIIIIYLLNNVKFKMPKFKMPSFGKPKFKLDNTNMVDAPRHKKRR